MDKKFVTIRLSETKSVYAVKVSDSPYEKYIDIDGNEHLCLRDADVLQCENMPVEVMEAFENLVQLYSELEELKKEQKELDKKIESVETQIRVAKSDVKEASGEMSLPAFIDMFYDALPENVRDKMEESGFCINIPEPVNGLGGDVICIVFEENVCDDDKIVRTYPFLHPDIYKSKGYYCMYNDAEKYLEYQRIIKERERHIMSKTELSSKLLLTDDWQHGGSNLYFHEEYRIPVTKKLTKEYAKELAKEVTKNFIYD